MSGSSERRIACPIPKNPPPRFGLDLDSPGSIFGSSHGSNVPVEECDQVHFDSFVIFHHQSEHAPCVGWQTPHTHTTKLAFAETVNPCNPCWGDGGLGRQFCECCFCDCSSPLLKILQRGIYNIFTTECASSRNCSLFYGGAHAPACVSKSSSHPKSYGETVKRMGP